MQNNLKGQETYLTLKEAENKLNLSHNLLMQKIEKKEISVYLNLTNIPCIKYFKCEINTELTNKKEILVDVETTKYTGIALISFSEVLEILKNNSSKLTYFMPIEGYIEESNNQEHLSHRKLRQQNYSFDAPRILGKELDESSPHFNVIFARSLLSRGLKPNEKIMRQEVRKLFDECIKLYKNTPNPRIVLEDYEEFYINQDDLRVK